jgi:hypothetical protein
MRVLLFDAEGDPDLLAGLRAEGLEVERPEVPPSPGPGATTALVAGLRGAEGALAGDPPAAVVVAGTGDEVLAAALTAVKLAIPTVWLASGEVGALIGRVADRSVDASAGAPAAAGAVRELAAPTIATP